MELVLEKVTAGPSLAKGSKDAPQTDNQGSLTGSGDGKGNWSATYRFC